MLIAAILFVICRLGCKKCGQIAERDPEFVPNKRNFATGLAFLTLFFLSSSAVLLYGNI